MPDEKKSDPAVDELEDAHNHADPAKDAAKSNITPVDQGCGVFEKNKKL